MLTVYLRIFRLTTCQSQKLIPKADFKWECPYYYSKSFLGRLGQYLKSHKMDFPLYFQIWPGQWEGVILEIPYGVFRVFSPSNLPPSNK